MQPLDLTVLGTADRLGADFALLGMTLWAALEAANPRAATWNKALSALNEARNAIAHAEEGRLIALRADGYPMTLGTIRRWERTLDALAAISRLGEQAFSPSPPER